jgi:isopentenyl-diphosphate delta-isomerase
MNMAGEQTKGRKWDHLNICSVEDVQARKVKTGFEDVRLIHDALPDLDLASIDTSTDFLGFRFGFPMIISAMTGGTEEAERINASLAEAAGELNLGICVGSQRAALEDPSLERTYRVVREKAPDAFISANIGCSQLRSDRRTEMARSAIEMIEANALTIHLNSLQEAVQPEGETTFTGVLAQIEEVVHDLKVPTIVKETGAGVARREAEALKRIGVHAVDVAGAGGTSWAAVEYYRARVRGDRLRTRLGLTFWDWGIPTAISLIECSQLEGLTLVASGGLRSGLDIAKSIALGATISGIALPLLGPAIEGAAKVLEEIRILVSELRTAMFLTGSQNIQSLKRAPLVITGEVAEWADLSNLDLRKYARR